MACARTNFEIGQFGHVGGVQSQEDDIGGCIVEREASQGWKNSPALDITTGVSSE
jgi:hypothetical protein